MRPTTIEPGQFRPGSQIKTLRHLLPYLWRRDRRDLRVRVCLAVVLLVAAKVANVYVPIILRGAVDALNAIGNPPNAAAAIPLALLLAYGAARVMAIGFGELRDAVFARVAQNAIRRIALRTFRHLHALSLRFHLERRTGALSRAIDRGTKGIEFLLSFMLFNVIPTLVEIFMVCGILWYLYNVWFALVTFVTIFGYIVFTMTVTEWRIKYRRAMNRTDEEANTKAVDSLLNYETVKYFGNEGHEARRFDSALERYEKAAVLSRTTLSALNVGQGAIIAVGLTLVMYMAGRGVINKTMSVGDFVLVNTYMIQLYLPLNFLGFVYREIKQSLTDMERMFSLLDVNEEVADAPDAKPLQVDKGEISFDHVNFSYDERRQILHDLSFTATPGSTVAIVGPTGSGKSTISRLLFRFYDATDGAIAIDGQPIRDVTQASLRAAIGIVPQDTVLFNDTIYYNIAYGRPGATKDEVEEAARMAQIHDFIAKLPDGYESMVGERGLKLSGGEKQRVAIARTILKNPPILLFDEATSALDTHTEKDIQASLRRVSRNRTTLVIAHRLSTVVEADEILVLDHGRVVERGTHAKLLAEDGAYAAMWRRQQEAQEKGEPIEDEETAAAE